MTERSHFAAHIVDRTLAHQDHGGWYESPEGLRCRLDGELVVPSAAWLTADDDDR